MKKKCIGIVGHSEGGMIAPIVAVENNSVDFIALLAGPGISIDELMIIQAYEMGKASGAPLDILNLNKEVLQDVYSFIRKNTTRSKEELIKELTNKFESHLPKFPADMFSSDSEQAEFINQQVEAVTSDWFLYFIKYTPDDYLSKVNVPVLAINGTLDLQVTAKENLAGIESSLKKAGNNNVTIKAFEHQNHLFQIAETGSASEYRNIEETFNEETMQFIANWINTQVK